MKNLLTLLYVVLLFLIPINLFAGAYYVGPTGSGSTCSYASPCALSYANSNAVAGDTIYLKGGTYNISGSCGICTSNSGTSGNMITFSAVVDETPIITGATTGWAFDLTNKRYIKVEGVTFHNIWRGDIMGGSDHIEIANCVFSNDVGVGVYFLALYEAGGNPVTNCWIHDNTFTNSDADNLGCAESGFNLEIGSGPDTGGSNYNTVENNVFSHSGHGNIETFGQYLVIKNNVFHNEPWRVGATNCNWPASSGNYTNTAYNTKYGHRNGQFYGDNFTNYNTWILFEGNRLGYAGANPGNDGPDGLALTSASNILRNNSFYANMNNGLLLKNGGDSAGNNNRIYNNTFYYNGYGYSGKNPGGGFPNGYESNTGISIYSNIGTGNVIKNNLLYNDYDYIKTYRDIQQRFGGNPSSLATISNNWITTQGDPKFLDPTITDVTSLILPNLNLQSSSGAIDGGTYLTTASGSGSGSTTLVVADARYFQDGTWGSDLARGVTFFPDWIAIGTVTNVVEITGINYSNNNITLASPMTWSNGANVWLYKNSSGTQVLYGSAPDYGAYEYGSGTFSVPILTGIIIIGGKVQ